MAVFFFLVGLEIKREFISGELSSIKQATLPIFGAIGGMVVPALLFASVNAGTPSSSGWGIPMATDIAFALGVVSLLGNRVAPALKVFLVALAIIDDIGAVIVIAVFYTSSISFLPLIIGFVLLGILAFGNAAGARTRVFYSIIGIGVWYCFLASGVHATVAGVLVAFTIPTRQRIDVPLFYEKCTKLLSSLIKTNGASGSILSDGEAKGIIRRIEKNCERVQPPLSRFEQSLHGFVAYLVMPIFVLANAGIALKADLTALFSSNVGIGIALGLVIGKPLGITAFAFLSTRIGLASLPNATSWRQMIGVGFLGGIGFTMSLFITSLAFSESELVTSAKLSILIASVIASMVGSLILITGKRHA
jgi:NhaA family Na+:H+ antiporter